MKAHRWLFKRVRRAAGRRGLNLGLQPGLADQDAFFAASRPVATEHALIRLGGDHDGGYLLPDDLEGIAACFSPGVETVATFEEAMVARGIKCFQVDASVADTPLTHPLVEFEPKFLGIVRDHRTITLDDWVEEKMPRASDDLVLQMDIEGAEWTVLAAASDDVLARFRIICLEAHHMEKVFDTFGFEVISQVFTKLLAQFDVVHVHANNFSQHVLDSRKYSIPSVLEYTFLRKDRSTRRQPVETLPHPLDQQNAPSLPPIDVPARLYRSATG